MVGIVVVSHSDALAQGVVALAREMGPHPLKLEAAGGTDQPGVLGTDAERVRAAIERAMSPDGVLVLMDLGSALMSTEFAVDLLGDTPGRVVMSEAPLVEGAVAAAASASGGASLAEVVAEARGALAMKTSQLGVEEDSAAVDEAPLAGPAEAQTVLEVRNAIGLHARPAARFVETVRRFDADVLRCEGSERPAGQGDQPHQRRRAWSPVRRYAGCHRLGAPGGRGVTGSCAAGRRGVRRWDRLSAAAPPPRGSDSRGHSQAGAGNRHLPAGIRRRPARRSRVHRARVRSRPPPPRQLWAAAGPRGRGSRART